MPIPVSPIGRTDHSHELLQQFVLEVNSLSNKLRWIDTHHADLTPAEHSLLESLHQQGPQTVPQMARARLTSRQNVQVLINRLRSRGLVQVSPNPAHRRSPLLEVSPAGTALIQTIASRNGDGRSFVLSLASVEEIAQATKVLSAIRVGLTCPGAPKSIEVAHTVASLGIPGQTAAVTPLPASTV